MAKPIQFEFDRASIRRFQNALSVYARATKKEAPDVCNRAAMNLSFRAASFTPKADKGRIQQLIGVRSPHGLTIWDLKRRGKKIPKRVQMQAAVNRMIAARLRTVAFIRAGWLPAARALQKVVRGGKSGLSRAAFGRRRPGKGEATLARESLRTFAEIVNRSTSKSPSSKQALLRYGGEGLRKGLAFVTKDMRDYATRLLAKQARRFNRS